MGGPRLPQSALDLEDKFAALEDLAQQFLGSTVVSVAIVSLNDTRGGQMVLNNPRHDNKLVARRLRLCADILEGM